MHEMVPHFLTTKWKFWPFVHDQTHEVGLRLCWIMVLAVSAVALLSDTASYMWLTYLEQMLVYLTSLLF